MAPVSLRHGFGWDAEVMVVGRTRVMWGELWLLLTAMTL